VEQAIIDKFPMTPGKFGTGVYFTSDATASAIRNINHNFLLYCEVAIGKYWTVDCSMEHLNFQEVRSRGYDSVFGQRGTQYTGGTEFDEHVVFVPEQAVPVYLVEYESVLLK